MYTELTRLAFHGTAQNIPGRHLYVCRYPGTWRQINSGTLPSLNVTNRKVSGLVRILDLRRTHEFISCRGGLYKSQEWRCHAISCYAAISLYQCVLSCPLRRPYIFLSSLPACLPYLTYRHPLCFLPGPEKQVNRPAAVGSAQKYAPSARSLDITTNNEFDALGIPSFLSISTRLAFPSLPSPQPPPPHTPDRSENRRAPIHLRNA
ncbi:hypothetical protein B0T19DRAFT_68053 [Cercophora scortea]|uniref:Uncharacterized protein n=1 Tax=Cercophora scortea TaxID=314031 RepID=A0AAE0J696_9PEZI|nr:hypothetical protein B0T19DRAFT_68053 [Cercophora scortea]